MSRFTGSGPVRLLLIGLLLLALVRSGMAQVELVIGTMDANSSLELSFDVTIEDPLPPGIGFITNQVALQAVSGLQIISAVSDDPETFEVDDPTVTTLFAVPILMISPAGGSVIISWTPDLPGFFLEQTDNLTLPKWVPAPSRAQNPVTVPVDPRGKFYRVVKPDHNF